MDSIKPSQHWRFDLFNFGILFCFLLFLRLPLFYPAVIHWDENTFTLIGADMLKGFLPYERLWDIKPPLCFAAYALFLKVFGGTLFAVRIGGFLFILFSSALIYWTASRLYSRVLGLLAALVLIFYSNTGDFYQMKLMHDFQAVMSEHIALLPMTAALALFLLKDPLSKAASFWLGLLCGVTIMVRFNLIYLIATFALSICLRDFRRNAKAGVFAIFFFVLGHLAVLMLVLLPYAIRNELALLFDRTLPLYLAYVEQKIKTFDEIVKAFRALLEIDFLVFAILGCGFLLRLVQRFLFNKRSASETRARWYIYLLFAGGVLSIFQAGASYPHYLIQLTPFFGLLVCDAVVALTPYISARFVTLPLLCLFLFRGGMTGMDNYLFWRNNAGIFQNTASKVARYLNEKGIKGQPVYFLTDHIAYFLTQAEIPTYYVQPSNISQRYILAGIEGAQMTPELALKKIFKEKPVYIVRPGEIFYFSVACPECYPVLDAELKMNYQLEKVIDYAKIYRRNVP